MSQDARMMVIGGLLTLMLVVAVTDLIDTVAHGVRSLMIAGRAYAASWEHEELPSEPEEARAPDPAPEAPASAAHAVRKGQREAPKVQEADA